MKWKNIKEILNKKKGNNYEKYTYPDNFKSTIVFETIGYQRCPLPVDSIELSI